MAFVPYEIAPDTPERICRACKAPKPLDELHFDRDSRCTGGFRWQCVDCMRARWRAWAESPAGAAAIDKKNARRREERRRDPKKARAESREKHARHRDAEREQFRDWQSQPDVRKRRSAEQAVRDAALVALGDGWRSPICQRHGFSLVRRTIRPECGRNSGRFAARRLDKPLERGEYVIAQYHVDVDGVGGKVGGNRWICLPPPLGAGSPAVYTEEDAFILRWLQGRSARGETTGLPRPETLSQMLDRLESEKAREGRAAVRRIVTHLEEVFARD